MDNINTVRAIVAEIINALQVPAKQALIIAIDIIRIKGLISIIISAVIAFILYHSLKYGIAITKERLCGDSTDIVVDLLGYWVGAVTVGIIPLMTIVFVVESIIKAILMIIIPQTMLFYHIVNKVLE